MEASALSEVIELPQGRIRCRAAGPAASERPSVVFVHGVLVDGELWTPVADLLAQHGVRSYAPTLPMGAHQTPMDADADLTPRGVARLVLDLIAALDLRDVTLVGNDTGGAITQFVLDTDPDRIGRVVLTNCDAFDAFPPPPLTLLVRALRHPGIVAAMVPGLRSTRLRHGPLGFGPLSNGPLDPALTGAWVRPLGDARIRRDLAKLARGIDPEDLLDVSTRLEKLGRPVHVLWGDDDRYFDVELGRRLADAFTDATFETVAGGRTFLPLDHPDRVAAVILAAA
ncbi:alpha/beta fold hydrolase [Frankia sp. AgB1.9]|uniref:alpha/beta fold hydrolase n=1 Tax=unclassified Frankia TaxID=2632575 RepID=UPI001932216A|nr:MULTISPECIES: alpha/beta fold hydrolase [unclassified Frankia]MBL7487948.1 alpha/beta fold hydrolase [Frankia sp. AgW1.1]MBL7550391.1 alpha/beta fold hydrolase [Frankia sp. AgB1.9]MBL7620861.1 alpha/beta fold hydrolase [Frankia sp. AgB1.8]